jgi:hypothetical protein
MCEASDLSSPLQISSFAMDGPSRRCMVEVSVLGLAGLLF